MAMPSSSRVQTSVIAHLQRRKAHARPDVPPQLAAILDQPGTDQHGEMALELAPALEQLGQAGARHLVEHGDAVGFQPGILALPEGRGGPERQQMGQEIGHLAHQVDAQLRIVEPDMDMHAADDQPPRRRLEIAGQRV